MLIEVDRVLEVKNSRIWPNVIVSPMAGVTDIAFRKLLWELADKRIGLTVSEFISVEAQPVLTPRNLQAITPFAGEKPFAVQLFGASPKKMAQAVIEVQELKPDFIEINAGCPMKAVIGRGGGSSLLKDLPRLQKMLHLSRKVLDIPLLLKTRIGWDQESINIVEVARIAEGEGVEMLTIHGRTREQAYKGLAHWPSIAKAAQSVKIPVIGNGDIATAEGARQRLQQYPELAGVSVGRALMHNPWLMAQVADLWSGLPVKVPGAMDLQQMFQRYMDLLIENGYTMDSLAGRLKQLVARILRFIEPDIYDIRHEILTSTHTAELLDKLWHFLEKEYKYRGCVFVPGRIKNLNGAGSTTIEE